MKRCMSIAAAVMAMAILSGAPAEAEVQDTASNMIEQSDARPQHPVPHSKIEEQPVKPDTSTSNQPALPQTTPPQPAPPQTTPPQTTPAMPQVNYPVIFAPEDIPELVPEKPAVNENSNDSAAKKEEVPSSANIDKVMQNSTFVKVKAEAVAETEEKAVEAAKKNAVETVIKQLIQKGNYSDDAIEKLAGQYSNYVISYNLAERNTADENIAVNIWVNVSLVKLKEDLKAYDKSLKTKNDKPADVQKPAKEEVQPPVTVKPAERV